ncbi:MAG: hypothetical protein ACI4QV_01930 [Acutalibacteraceae bacterium]
MSMENQNLAYDFEMFETKKTKVVSIEQSESFKKETAEQLSAEKKERIKDRLTNILLIAFIIAVLCAGLYTRGQITEVNDQINKVQDEINILENDKVRLEMELESIVSFETLAEDAQALGMQPKEKTQTVYITMNNEDKAEVLSEDEPTFAESLKAIFKR